MKLSRYLEGFSFILSSLLFYIIPSNVSKLLIPMVFIIIFTRIIISYKNNLGFKIYFKKVKKTSISLTLFLFLIITIIIGTIIIPTNIQKDTELQFDDQFFQNGHVLLKKSLDNPNGFNITGSQNFLKLMPERSELELKNVESNFPNLPYNIEVISTITGTGEWNLTTPYKLKQIEDTITKLSAQVNLIFYDFTKLETILDIKLPYKSFGFNFSIGNSGEYNPFSLSNIKNNEIYFNPLLLDTLPAEKINYTLISPNDINGEKIRTFISVLVDSADTNYIFIDRSYFSSKFNDVPGNYFSSVKTIAKLFFTNTHELYQALQNKLDAILNEDIEVSLYDIQSNPLKIKFDQVVKINKRFTELSNLLFVIISLLLIISYYRRWYNYSLNKVHFFKLLNRKGISTEFINNIVTIFDNLILLFPLTIGVLFTSIYAKSNYYSINPVSQLIFRYLIILGTIELIKVHKSSNKSNSVENILNRKLSQFQNFILMLLFILAGYQAMISSHIISDILSITLSMKFLFPIMVSLVVILDFPDISRIILSFSSKYLKKLHFYRNSTKIYRIKRIQFYLNYSKSIFSLLLILSIIVTLQFNSTFYQNSLREQTMLELGGDLVIEDITTKINLNEIEGIEGVGSLQILKFTDAKLSEIDPNSDIILMGYDTNLYLNSQNDFLQSHVNDFTLLQNSNTSAIAIGSKDNLNLIQTIQEIGRIFPKNINNIGSNYFNVSLDINLISMNNNYIGSFWNNNLPTETNHIILIVDISITQYLLSLNKSYLQHDQTIVLLDKNADIDIIESKIYNQLAYSPYINIEHIPSRSFMNSPDSELYAFIKGIKDFSIIFILLLLIDIFDIIGFAGIILDNESKFNNLNEKIHKKEIRNTILDTSLIFSTISLIVLLLIVPHFTAVIQNFIFIKKNYEYYSGINFIQILGISLFSVLSLLISMLWNLKIKRRYH